MAHTISTTRCPACGYIANRAMASDGTSDEPIPGDLMVCGGCTHLLMFDERLEAIEPTPEVLDSLGENYMAAVRKAQDAVLQARGKIASERGN